MACGYSSLAPRLIGPYSATLTVAESVLDRDAGRLAVDLDIQSLIGLRIQVDHAIDSLRERHMQDAVCGSCDQCSNTRMVQVKRSSRTMTEHCPVCWPKIDAARAIFETGLSANLIPERS